MNTTIAIDPGAGAVKVFTGAHYYAAIPAIISTNGAARISDLAGLASGAAPKRIETPRGAFLVGLNAHEWGRPVENLDPDRFTGSPELAALLYTALDQAYGLVELPATASVIVGLPLNILTGEEAAANAADVKTWLLGKHTWSVNGRARELHITGARITSQPVGALMDFMLDAEGHYIPENKRTAKGELGIMSIGMNTVELLAVNNLQIVQRFTAGRASGVRRLLELCNPNELYSRGEMDSKLRSGALDYKAALPVWAAEVSDAINKRWGDAWRRFALVIITGGGSYLLQEQLTAKFAGRVWFPADPILSTAAGLYKFSLRKSA